MVDYYSFDDVLKELQLNEDELKRMVSEGQIRAFRSENKMKFKKEDIEKMRKEKITEPTIILPASEEEESILDLDIPLEGISPPTAKPTETIESGTTAVPTETLNLDQTDISIGLGKETSGLPAEDTFVTDVTDTSIPTETLQLSEEGLGTEDLTKTLGGITAGPPPKTKVTQIKKKKEAIAVPAAVEAEIERRKPSVIWTIIIMLAFAVVAYCAFFFYDLMRVEQRKTDRPANLTAGTAEWVLSKYYEDPEWRNAFESKFPEGYKPTRYSRPTFRDSDEPTGAGLEEMQKPR